MSKNPRIYPLNEALMIVQLDDYAEKFESETKKENRIIKKWLKVAFIPTGIALGVSALTATTLPLIIGTIYCGGVALVKMYIDGKEEIIPKRNTKLKITPIESNTPDYSFLNEPIIKKEEKDYRSDYFKERLAEAAKITKLRLVSERKNENEEQVEIPGFLDKEETMIQVSTEYNTYKIAYNLPALSITNKEWDILFDTIYHKLEELNQVERFYDYMSFLLRYVIAYSLIHNSQDITFLSFINQIHRLEFIGIPNNSIKEIVKELTNYLKPTPIVNLNIYKLVKSNN